MATPSAPLPDSVVNAWLAPLKAAGVDEAAIDAALTRLLAHPDGRTALIGHLADFAALATDDTIPDAGAGRWLRRHFQTVDR